MENTHTDLRVYRVKRKTLASYINTYCFVFLQTEGEEDESYEDPMNVVPKTPQS